MNDALISNWNSVVKKEDEVYVLGDFALCNKDSIIKIGQQLNGIKTLIIGNHDQAAIDTYYKAGFKFVSKNPIIIKNFFILSHYPPALINSNSLYGYFYAHVHDSEEYKTATPHSACVSAERWDYKPVELDHLIKLMEESK